MSADLTIKDSLRERRLFERRALVTLLGTVLLLLILLGRLFYLQVLGHEHFITLSDSNRVKPVAIPPTRGLIYDRNGVVLAHNLPSFSLEVVPEDVPDLDATLAELGTVIAIEPSDIERFKAQVKQRPRFTSIPLRFRLSDQEVASFAVNRHRFPGVDIEARLARHYPLGELTAHAVGYVGRINEQELKTLDAGNYSATSHVGKVGVEGYYEDLLHGEVGHEQVEVNAQGRVLRVLGHTPPTPGRSIYLHLDSRLQAVATDALESYRGSVVAIEIKTGGVVAFVSKPGYDPNPFVNGIDAASYKALRQAEDRPLFNRALRGQYPPGSTIKPFIALAGLEEQVTGAESTTYCPGFYRLGGRGRRYRCWKRVGHGHVDLERAIVESCDVYFYNLARDLGIDRLHDFLAGFRFGRPTGVDLSGELPGVLPSREWKRGRFNQPWYPGETLIVGIGQGYDLVTPLQLADATAILARRGKVLTPRLLYAESDPDSVSLEVRHPPAEAPMQVRSPHNWDRVIRAMTQVVHGRRGTARRIAKDAPVRIAGKTGTAQVFAIKQDEKYDEDKVPEKLRDHALFIAFAPVDDPLLAVGVLVENGGHGGSVAAPVARKVIDAYLRLQGLIPAATEQEAQPRGG
jgi:penicillin-binding protein 2